jgi:hypothetical protein
VRKTQHSIDTGACIFVAQAAPARTSLHVWEKVLPGSASRVLSAVTYTVVFRLKGAATQPEKE